MQSDAEITSMHSHDLHPVSVAFKKPVLPEYLLSSRLRDMHYGGNARASSGVVEYGDIEVRLGAKPIAWRLRQLKMSIGGEQAAELEVFDAFDVWLIAHAISVMARESSRPPAALGYVAEALLDGVSVIRTLPDTSLVRAAGGSLVTSALLRLNGQMESPSELTQAARSIYGLTGDAKLEVSSSAEIMGRISFACWTPLVVSTGACDKRCEWRFTRDDKPLLGTQLMFQTMLVPRGTRRLPMRLSGYALLYKPWLPCQTMVSTEPMGAEIEIAGAVN